jgi:hypothetical protein
MTLSLLLACAPDPAPQDVDGLLHWSWTEFELASDEQWVEAAANLPRDDQEGEQSRLVEEEVAHVDWGADSHVGLARGMYIANTFSCDLEVLQEILIAQDQQAQYEGVYDRYDRSYTSDLDAFTAGAAGALSWDVELEGEYVGTAYTERLHGGVRRVEGALIARTWIAEPVEFEEGSDWWWPTDVQIEVFVQEDLEIVHLYGIWRELDIGSLSTEDDGLVNLTRGGMRDWDDRTEELCELR